MASKRYASIFGAIADAPREAENLRLRAEVMQHIAQHMGAKAGRNAKPPHVAASRSHAFMTCCVDGCRASRWMHP